MSESNIHFAVILTVLAMLGVPTLAAVVRIAVMFTRSQDRIEAVAGDVTELARQAREDRHATNERLAWLERNAWR